MKVQVIMVEINENWKSLNLSWDLLSSFPEVIQIAKRRARIQIQFISRTHAFEHVPILVDFNLKAIAWTIGKKPNYDCLKISLCLPVTILALRKLTFWEWSQHNLKHGQDMETENFLTILFEFLDLAMLSFRLQLSLNISVLSCNNALPTHFFPLSHFDLGGGWNILDFRTQSILWIKTIFLWIKNTTNLDQCLAVF